MALLESDVAKGVCQTILCMIQLYFIKIHKVEML